MANKDKKQIKREFSAGGAVFKKENGRVLWLVIQPKGGARYDKIRWQLPKGWIDEGEKSEEGALREVEEEGGVKAKLIEKIDTIKIFFRDVYRGKPEQLVSKFIIFYLMEYQTDTKEGPGWETKEVAWFPYEEAHKKLTFKREKEILEKAARKVREMRTTCQSRLNL